ncbi:MAG TPA: histidine phosphatase family protein [Thermoplasmata archaeon]|nr:histidine phosphatase family protein [Thermoplasmata archaeon]
MRMLEHRRHGQRLPGGTHLSAEGVRKARIVGNSIGPFYRVVTSPRPRAIETAVAMGFAVDYEIPELARFPEDLEPTAGATAGEQIPFDAWAREIKHNPRLKEYAETQAFLWRSALDDVPDGGHVLMISHGGIIEVGALGADFEGARGLGDGLHYLEGVRLEWTGTKWGRIERVRSDDGP